MGLKDEASVPSTSKRSLKLGESTLSPEFMRVRS